VDSTAEDAEALVRQVCRDTAALHERTARERAGDIARAAATLREALVAGRKVLVFGNGGSAADAEHLAAELVGRFRRERRPVAAVALTADTAVVTSLANDYAFEAVFARQVEALGQPGDVALGITTSGASRNVNAALEHARLRGLVTVALTGRDGGETAGLVDVHVNVPGDDTARVQEVQRTILHVICEIVERAL
jgi:D-sedoheptulose 7-phosphate isomerase